MKITYFRDQKLILKIIRERWYHKIFKKHREGKKLCGITIEICIDKKGFFIGDNKVNVSRGIIGVSNERNKI